MTEQRLDIQSIFMQETQENGWKELSGTEEQLTGAADALENTRKVVASRCYGDQTRIDASNAMFQQAKAGVDTARRTLFAAKLAQPKAPGQQSPWLTVALLAGTVVFSIFAVSVKLGFLKSFMAVVAALLAGAALVMEVLRLWSTADLPGMLKKLVSFVPARKLRKWLEKSLENRQKKAAEPETEQPAPEVVLDAPLLEECLQSQLALIEQNLPTFTEQPQTVVHPGGDELWPLVRTMLQSRYTAGAAFPERVEDELENFLTGNGITLVDYSKENAHLFTTQQMDETFTIFPALIKDGKVLERGRAAVAKEG